MFKAIVVIGMFCGVVSGVNDLKNSFETYQHNRTVAIEKALGN
jgi:hypothetical protein